MDGGKYKIAKNVDNVDNFVEKFIMQTLLIHKNLIKSDKLTDEK